MADIDGSQIPTQADSSAPGTQGVGAAPAPSTAPPAAPPRKRSLKRLVLWVLIGGLVLFGLIQLVPYGHATGNPPVVKEPNWDSPQTRALAKRACFDCHSNETKRWWATEIAPFSWLAQADVSGGRERLNFSDWKPVAEPGDLYEAIQSGSMPPLQYTIAHPNAKLSDSEKRQLVDGLKTTIAQTP